MDQQEAQQPHHPIESLMKTAMQSIKEMVDVNTVVGDAVETNDGSVIIPISQVACGFAAGGGSGAGVSVKPIGFLVVRMNDVRLISVSGNPLAERVVDVAPQIFDKIESIMQRRDQNRTETYQ